ncbi:MAG: COR domain-containing protein [Saprospiraceae bacterium]
MSKLALQLIHENIEKQKRGEDARSLDLGNCGMTEVPEEIGELVWLEELDLSINSNLLDILPVSLLNNLQLLNCSNTGVSNLTSLIPFVKNGIKITLTGKPVKGEFDFKGCPLTIPPTEVVEQGNEAFLRYLEEHEKSGSVRLYEAKLLVIGDGGAGKTTLVRKLLDVDSLVPSAEESTRGIEIHPLYFNLPDGNRLRLDVWDFAGQGIYQNLNNFFFTHRSLYVLVDDTRTLNEDGTFYNYWLQTAKLLGGNSPLIVVQNQKSDRVRSGFNLSSIQADFPFVKELFRINLARDSSGILDLKRQIEQWALKLPHIGELVPTSWMRVRENIEAERQAVPYISFSRYKEICAFHDITDTERQLHLSQFLHDIGIFLHFQDSPILHHGIFLQNQWVLEAMYIILGDSDISGKKYGRFDMNDLARIWNGSQYSEYRDELLDLMLRFEICYQMPDRDTFIIPQLLPSDIPIYDIGADEEGLPPLQIRYEYSFMPKGLFSRLIVRMHRYIAPLQWAVWKSGVVLVRSGAYADIVESLDRRTISVRAKGLKSKELLTIIVHEIESLHENYPGLRVQAMIPCNCQFCQTSVNPNFYNKAEIETRLKKGRLTIECYNSFEDISIQGLLEGLFSSIEVSRQGHKAAFRYVEEQEKQGENPLREAKIVVVGAGEAGKTTLIKKLQNPAHPVPNEVDKRTEGVTVTPLNLNKEKDGQTVKATVWDLGGQELYHTTHQFFLTPDTFYILLNDNRKNDTDFYYWLNILALRAGDECPIFCIFNQKENATRQISLDEHLFGNFPGLLQCPEDVDFADKDFDRFDRLRATIETHFLTLPVLGKKFPSYWVNVRDALVKIKSPYISWKQFQAVCVDQKIPEDDEQQMEIVAQTMHNLGNLLWYPQVFGMRNWVILNPQWCLDAMYKVLDFNPVAKAEGRFERKLLEDMWRGESYAELTLQLEQLMRHFDLCYETEQDSGKFIAPQLLPLEAKLWPDFPKQGCITFKHKYEFMPAGLMSRFIARMARYVHSDYVWRKGVTLRWDDNTYGEAIENPLEREITLQASGPERKRRMNEMRQTLEIVESLFRGLKLQSLVSCNCPNCVGSATPKTFDLTILENHKKLGVPLVCDNGALKTVSARNILEGIKYTDTPRIFISYAHRNEDFKDEFRKMIAPLEKTKQWEVWDDRYLLPGDEWNKKIMQQIAEANVIVLLLTSDFFNSDYIYDIELTRAVERHENGTALLVGVVVADCMWEETPLSKVQILPKDALPVERHPNRSEVWKVVAKKIQEAIAAREQRRKTRMGEDF